jgi:hypothetical protein
MKLIKRNRLQIVASKDTDLGKENEKLGALSVLAAIYKHGKREDLRLEAATVLKVSAEAQSRAL